MSAGAIGLEDAGLTPGRSLLPDRLAIAAVQAVVLYALAESAVAPRSWPASAPAVFAPMLLAAVFEPILALFGRSTIPRRPLAVWVAVAGLVVAGLGYHDAVRGRIPDWSSASSDLPRFQLWAALAASLFVAHVLVTDAVAERRLRTSYPRHFDTAWKLGVQVVLALAFVGVFWGVLEFGARLFDLLKIDVFTRLLAKRWFYLPATTLAAAASIHVTDVQPALIRGARSLALSLLSWLTPLLALIVLGFLVSLPFVSLEPLWHTHFATALLLSAAAMLIVLVNCCYQDGAAERTRSRPKRFAAALAAAELAPLAALSAWGLGLRVGQYGWSVERITAGALVLIVSCYAIGYACSAIRPRAWLSSIEATNGLAAYAVLAVILALSSPLADPARLMVADQISRLRSGAATPDTFDFAALKFDGARWGVAALIELHHGGMASDDAAQARIVQTLAAANRYQLEQALHEAKPEDWMRGVAVLPTGRTLPDDVLDPDFASRNGVLPGLCQPKGAGCVARFVTLEPGAPEAIVLASPFGGDVFEQDAESGWRKTGSLHSPANCLAQAVRSGPLDLKPHAAPDVIVDGQRLTILPASQPEKRCPDDAPPARAAPRAN